MAWNPLKKIREAFGKPEPRSPGAAAPDAPAKKADDSSSDLKELEKKGLLGSFFRRWKDPGFASQLRALTARMQADGVDIKDRAAVKAWVESHKAEIESGRLSAPSGPKTETFVNSAPQVGRNSPCGCGSGKKFKKCCGK